jgi:hypothetical protein
MSLWYVWRQPCTYFAPTQTPSSNRPKQDSKWPLSPRSSIGCVKNDYRAYGTFGTPILRQDQHYLQTDRNELPVQPRKLGVPSCVSKMISEAMKRFTQTMCLSCTNTNTHSKWMKTRFHRTHGTEEFYRARPKRFSSLRYFHRKPCTKQTENELLVDFWASSPIL